MTATSEHTPDYMEPWTIGKSRPYTVYRRDGGHALLYRDHRNRAVVCVNALVGIETARLEHMNIDAALYDSASAFADEKNRADEAAALLAEAQEHLAYACDRWEFLMSNANMPKTAGQREVLKEIRAWLGARKDK